MANQGFDITDPVVNYFSIPVTQQSIYANTGMLYDCAINGDPFLFATSDDNPYVRQFAQMKKDQLDITANPGEQSLTMWWTRNQSDWSGGSGIKYYEPVSDDTIMRSYHESVGIDPWTVGQVSLLNQMKNVATISGAIDFCIVNSSSSSAGESIVTVTGSAISLYTYNPTTETFSSPTSVTGASGTILGVVSVGDRFVVWTSTVIYISNTALTSVTSMYTNPTNHTFKKVWFAKQRLWVAGIDTNAATSVLYAAPLYLGGSKVLPDTDITTNFNSAWVWSSLVSTPQYVAVAGYVGDSSVIYKITVEENGAGVLATGSPMVLAELPRGEIVYSMASYVGSYVGICTNKGFRVGLVDDYGNLTYGQLLVENTTGFQASAGYGSFMFFAGTGSVAGQHGLWRVNLGDQKDNAYTRIILTKYPVASDVYCTETTGNMLQMKITTGGKKVFLTDSGKIYYESVKKLSSGYITMGQIRYTTYEPKLFKKVTTKGTFPSGTSVGISSITADDAEYSMFTVSDTDIAIDVTPYSPQYSMGFKLTLNSNSTNTASPVVKGFQTKSLPAVNRQEIITIPLLCFDFESDMHNNKSGASGSAKKRYTTLYDDVKIGNIILYQDFHSGENLQLIVEDLQFKQVAPPRPNVSGFGGILTIQARTVL